MNEQQPALAQWANSGQQEHFTFIGTHLSLDFANTLGGLRGGSTQEFLLTYADLLVWGRQAGVVGVTDAGNWLEQAQRDLSQAEAVLARAHRLREAIYHLVKARIEEQLPHTTDMTALNNELALALSHHKVAASQEGFAWIWETTHLSLDAVLWPVSAAAAELLVARESPFLRECASAQCSWLFLDTTRNHSRRWCDMKGCGNQAKIRRYRQRQG